MHPQRRAAPKKVRTVCHRGISRLPQPRLSLRVLVVGPQRFAASAAAAARLRNRPRPVSLTRGTWLLLHRSVRSPGWRDSTAHEAAVGIHRARLCRSAGANRAARCSSAATEDRHRSRRRERRWQRPRRRRACPTAQHRGRARACSTGRCGVDARGSRLSGRRCGTAVAGTHAQRRAREAPLRHTVDLIAHVLRAPVHGRRTDGCLSPARERAELLLDLNTEKGQPGESVHLAKKKTQRSARSSPPTRLSLHLCEHRRCWPSADEIERSLALALDVRADCAHHHVAKSVLLQRNLPGREGRTADGKQNISQPRRGILFG